MFQYTLYNYQFIFATLAIRERFRVFNQYLSKAGEQTDNFLSLNVLDDSMKMHDQLSAGISLINSTFTPQLVFYTGFYLCITVTCVHFAIVNLFYNTFFVYYPIMLVNIYWIAFYTKVLCSTMHAGATTVDEARKTGTIVHRVLNQINGYRNRYCIKKVLYIFKIWIFVPPKMLLQLKLFSQQLVHFNPVLKNRFFVIDWTLGLSVSSKKFSN